MAFNRPTLNDLIVRIENDITSRLTGLVPLLSRALLKILARVFAGAFDSVYGNQQFISFQVNVGTASEEWVRRYAYQWGVQIQEATFADATYKFTGANSNSVPLNTILVRDDNIEYVTTSSGNIGDTVSGELSVSIQCRSSGTLGNALGGTPLSLVSPIIGVDTNGLIVGSGAEGGIDGDTVEEIRTNVLNRMQLPPMGGSTNDYKVVAEGVAGVAKAFVFPNQAGLGLIPGSVTVVIKGLNPVEASAALLQNVLDAINDPNFKPTTASHYTDTIDGQNIYFDLSITPNNTTIQNTITQHLIDTFNADGIPGGTLLISHIRNAISTSGVTNYVIDSIFVNGQGYVSVDNDINFTNFEYPIVFTPINFVTL